MLHSALKSDLFVIIVLAQAVLLQLVHVNGDSNIGPSGETSATSNYDVDVQANIPIHVTDERFLSVALDAHTLKEHWQHFNFSSVKLQTMTRALSPGYVRVGGFESDFLIFKNPCDSQTPPNTPYETSEFYMCPADWDGINKFCVDTGLKLIFGLNLLLRTKDGRWDPSNAETLLYYNTYDVHWELGNEPNAFKKKANVTLSGPQIAGDFNMFRSVLQSRPKYVGASVYGPDMSAIGKKKTTAMLSGHPNELHVTAIRENVDRFLGKTNATNATTFHSYYLDGRTATVDDFLKPETLDDLLPDQIDLVESLVATYYGDGAKVWLGESGSAYGGGAVNISDRFVAGFLFLDKLGMSARMGLGVVIRQTYYGGHYTMLDLDNLDPKPDYWIAYIYKFLVGPQVLRATIRPAANRKSVKDKKYVRVYAHCTATRQSGYDAGAVTLIILNMHKTESANITLVRKLGGQVVQQYLLTPYGPEGMTALQVNLNHHLFQLENDTILPEIKPVRIKRGNPILLPPLSYGFYVVAKAKAKACMV